MFKEFRRNLRRQRIINAPVFKCYIPRISPLICDSRCIISKSRRFVYFRIPKAANSTVTASLHFAETGKTPTTWREMDRIKKSYTPPSRLSRRSVETLFDDFFTFTIVRNPFSRLISAYLDKIAGKEDPRYRRKVAEYLGVGDDTTVTLADFVGYLEGPGNRDRDPHWCQQTDLIFIPVEELDFVGRFESLDTDLAAILQQLYPGTHQRVDWTPHATSADNKAKQMIDARLAERIVALYERDFDQLGYPKVIQ